MNVRHNNSVGKVVKSNTSVFEESVPQANYKLSILNENLGSLEILIISWAIKNFGVKLLC